MPGRKYKHLLGVVAPLCLLTNAAIGADRATIQIYDDFETDVAGAAGYDQDDYDAKWFHPFFDIGVGEPTLPVGFEGGALDLDAVPFTYANGEVTSLPFPAPTFDHIKYIGVSNEEFSIPVNGSLMFSADIVARTPGAVPGLEMRATDAITGEPVHYDMLEGRQAMVTLHMINLLTSDPAESGQLFDFLVSENKALGLTERLFGFGNPPGDVNKAYTQIVFEVDLEPGVVHNFAIRYSRKPGLPKDQVEWLIDGKVVGKIKTIGVPLDDQRPVYYSQFPITDPSDPAGAGEELKSRMNTVRMAHGLFSLLDVWPYGAATTSTGFSGVVIPDGSPTEGIKSDGNGDYVDTRIWGQGAQGYLDNFTVTKTGEY